jgi:hypothetical protein
MAGLNGRVGRLERRAAGSPGGRWGGAAWVSAVRGYLDAMARGTDPGAPPVPPPGVPADRWPDVLAARACWAARLARELDPDGYLSGMTAGAVGLADRMTAGVAAWFARLRELPAYRDEPRPYFLPEVVPAVVADPSADAILAAMDAAGVMDPLDRVSWADLELLTWLDCMGESPEPHVTYADSPHCGKPLWWRRLRGETPASEFPPEGRFPDSAAV